MLVWASCRETKCKQKSNKKKKPHYIIVRNWFEHHWVNTLILSIPHTPDLNSFYVCEHTSPENLILPFKPVHHHEQNQRTVKWHLGQGHHSDLHRAGMGYKTISKTLGEKVTTAAAIIQKWKKHEMIICRPWFAAPCKIMPCGMRTVLRKVED